jgi:hypothetical protein
MGDHRYVADLLLIDVAQQRVDILHCGSERGHDPRRVGRGRCDLRAVGAIDEGHRMPISRTT